VEQRFILYALLFGSGMLLFRLLRQKNSDTGRTFQAGIAVGATLMALLRQEEMLYFGIAAASFVLLVMLPAVLARSAMEGSGKGYGISIRLLPYFWWGSNGVALQKIGRVHHAIQKDQPELAASLLLDLTKTPLSPGLRAYAASLDILLSATQLEWSLVLEKIARVPNHPGGQLPAARAFGEMGQPAPALKLLRILLLRPSTARALPQFYGAELCAYCSTGDLEAVLSAVARIQKDGVKVPPGYFAYWIGRCHYALGDEASARPHLLEAQRTFQEAQEKGEHFVGLQAALTFVEYLLANPLVHPKEVEFPQEYAQNKAAFLEHLKPMRPWFLFFGSGKPTPVTHYFIAACGVFLAPLYLGKPDLYFDLLERYANYSPYVFGRGEMYRLFSANFLHAGLTHFLFNGFALYLFARPVERTWGSKVTFLALLLSGIGGHFVSALFHSDGASVGASTAVYGILAMYILTFVRYRAPGLDRFRNQRITFLLFLVLCDVGLSLTEPMIDTPGHLGGLFVGALFGGTIIARDKWRA